MEMSTIILVEFPFIFHHSAAYKAVLGHSAGWIVLPIYHDERHTIINRRIASHMQCLSSRF